MSHLQGTNYVGSMVVFEDALAKKADYRHFNVKEVFGNDDAGAMQEVVRRRLGYWNEEQAQSKFRRANLIIIDGGLPQLHAAEKAAASLGLSGKVEFVALAKREELLYRPGSSTPIALDRGSESLYLVQRIRDEAHRFAISFHRSKRAKSMVATLLDGVDGLGPKRRERLMLQLGSLENLRAATLDELTTLEWLPDVVAQNIYDRLRAPSAPRLAKGTKDD
jgi:excinuclease ABC subunit C